MTFYPVANQFLPLAGGTVAGLLTTQAGIADTGGITESTSLTVNGPTNLNGGTVVAGALSTSGLNNITSQVGLIANTGNLDIKQAGKGLQVAEGSNAKQGTAVLSAGAVTVADTAVTANSRIFLTSQADGGTPGFVRVSARTAGTSFTITSGSGTDTSTIGYEIFEPG